MAHHLRKLRQLRLPSIRPNLRGWRSTEAGQSLVEFALILPVFLLLLFALVDFGRGFYTWLIVTNAAREGARAGAVQMDDAGVRGKVYDAFCDSYPSDCALDPAKMVIDPDNVQGDRGDEVKVTVTYDFDYVTPIGDLINLLTGGSIDEPTIVASSSMRLE